MKLELPWQKKKMASCFDFRTRTSSFDLHQLVQRRKLSKIARLFRSKSDDDMKTESPRSSPRESPKGSPQGQVRRRFVRVVRNENSEGEEWENPHVIRRYTNDFLQEQWSQMKAYSLDEHGLPYTVTGHTILKKHSSIDSDKDASEGSPTPTAKHTSFNTEVEIIEFDKRRKPKKCTCFTHTEKLASDDEEEEDSSSGAVCPMCRAPGKDCPHLSSDSDLSDSDNSLPERRHKKSILSRSLSAPESTTDSARLLAPSAQDSVSQAPPEPSYTKDTGAVERILSEQLSSQLKIDGHGIGRVRGTSPVS